MPTDNERREVARRLRENAEAHPDMSLILNVAFADDRLRPDGAMEWRVTPHDAAMRLADLIESSDSAQTVAEDMFGQMRHSTEQERIAYADMMARNSVELHPVDRDVLLELADEMDAYTKCDDERCGREMPPRVIHDFARRIREALGVER